MQINRPYQGVFKTISQNSQNFSNRAYRRPIQSQIKIGQIHNPNQFKTIASTFHDQKQIYPYKKKLNWTNKSKVPLGQPQGQKSHDNFKGQFQQRIKQFERKQSNPLKVQVPYKQPLAQTKTLAEIKFKSTSRPFDIIKNQDFKLKRQYFEGYDQKANKGKCINNWSIKPTRGLRYNILTGQLMDPLPK